MEWVSAEIVESGQKGKRYLRVDQNGRWDGIGGPRSVYKNRKKVVRGCIIYSGSGDPKSEWQEKGRLCIRGYANDLDWDGAFNMKKQMKG